MSDSSFAWFGMTSEALIAHLRQLADELEIVERGTTPLASKVLINDWALARRTVPCLMGFPTAHPKIEDGSPICSSGLYYLDESRGLARSFSRWYRLGRRVAPEFWNQKIKSPQ